MKTTRTRWMFVAMLLIPGVIPTATADDWDEAMKTFEIVDRWSNYASHGQQYSADIVVDNLVDARQQRVFITIIEERIRAARAKVQTELVDERRWDYDRSSGGPNVVVGPDMAELRRLQQRKLRDLERTIGAYDAVLACLDPEDDRCVEVREIDRRRAQWQASGDPLPPDPDVPGADDMRKMLEAALERHRLTLQRYRKDLERLQRATNDLGGAHIIVEDRLDELGEVRRSVQKTTTELRQRRTTCEELCGEARGFAEIVRRLGATSGADAVTARQTVERKLDDARALAAACRTAAEADRILDLLDGAERDFQAVTTDLDLARSSNLKIGASLGKLATAGDVADLRKALSAQQATASEAGGAIIDQMVVIERVFDDLGELRPPVADLAEKLRSLDFLDDEVRSWERALSGDDATQKVMQQRFAELRRGYEMVRSQAARAVEWTDELTAVVGGPDLLRADVGDASDELQAAQEAAFAVAMPECDADEADLTTLVAEHGRIRELLRAAPDLRAAAAACRARSGTAPPPPPATPQASPAVPSTGQGSPPPPPTATPTPTPTADVHGGLVITGLPQPARIAVGQVVQLEGRDHGGRPYTGVEWVSSNEQVLPASPGGRIVAQQKGEAMVLAKLDGMRAWLDVEVVDPGRTPSNPPPPLGGGAGAPGSSGAGSTGVPSAGGGATPAGGGAGSSGTGPGAVDEFDFGDGGSGTVEVAPADDGLLGVSPSTDAGDAVPAAPTRDDVVQMLQQVDCSWLPGSVPAYDQGSGQTGCTCPPGTELATDRPACLDCAGPQNAFIGAVDARNFQLAQQAIHQAQGCGWATHAQAQLTDFVCTQAEIAVLEALNSAGPTAAQNAIQRANAQGCGVSQQTVGLVASAAQPPPSAGSPPPKHGPDATEMMQMLGAVTQSLIAMQGGDPVSVPSLEPTGTTTPAPAPGGAGTSGGQGNPGEDPQQCARRLCERECADAIGLLTEGTTAACDRCLKSRVSQCTGGGGTRSGAPGSGGSPQSSGSGAWAFPQWTMPTGEGGGRCYAGKSWTKPYRYAIACDGNDGSAVFKLSFGGHPGIVFGPASFTDCQRYLAQLTGGQ